MPFVHERTWSHVPGFHAVNGVFTPEECTAIIDCHKQVSVTEARSANGPVSYRDTDVFWLRPENQSYRWVYDRVTEHSIAFNQKTYAFEFDACTDLQLARYRPGQHYDWHTDLSSEGYSRRKLSIAIMLSPAEDYRDGQLQFGGDQFTENAAMTQGSAVFFPSWLRHRVTPVTTGERWTLVGWWLGPPFR